MIKKIPVRRIFQIDVTRFYLSLEKKKVFRKSRILSELPNVKKNTITYMKSRRTRKVFQILNFLNSITLKYLCIRIGIFLGHFYVYVNLHTITIA